MNRVVGVRQLVSLELRDRLRTGPARPAIMLLALLAVVLVVTPVLPKKSASTEMFRYGVVGPEPAGLAAVMQAPAGVDVRYVVEPDVETADHAVATGALSAAVVDGRVVARSDGSADAVVLLTRALTRSAAVQRLEQAGVGQVEAVRAALASGPRVTVLSPPSAARRAAIALARMIVTFTVGLQVIVTNLTALGVQEERGTRMADMLLVPLSPGQIVAAKVGSATGLTLFALAVAGVLAAALAVAIHGLHIVGENPVTLAAAGVFVTLQLALYSFAAAASGATVAGVLETQGSIIVVDIVMLGSGYLARTVVVSHPNSIISTIISIFPTSAPMAMLVRTAAGHVPVWQLGLSLLLTGVLVAWVARAAAWIYLGAVVGSDKDKIKIRRAYRIGRSAMRSRRPTPRPHGRHRPQQGSAEAC